MYNKKAAVLPLLIAASMLLTGFSWNFGADKCRDAQEIAAGLPQIPDESTRLKQEEKVLELCPDGAAAQFVAGVQAERAGNPDSAAAAYRRALQKEPEMALASGNIGLIYLQKGLQDDAAVALSRAIISQPLPAYLKGMARIMTDKKFYSLALYYYAEAAKKLPSDPDILAGQAEVYAADGQTDRAMSEFRRVLLLSPVHEQASYMLSTILVQQKQYDPALEILKKSSAAHPKSARLHLLLADIYDQKGDQKQADFERLLGGKKKVAVEDKPKQSAMIQADQLAEKGEFDKAIDAYRAVLVQEPDRSIEVYEKIGNAYYRTGRDAEAIQAYREAIYQGSSKWQVCFNLAQTYEKRAQLDEAVVSYKRAIELNPELAEAHLKLAEIRMQRGSVQEAIAQYAAFLKLKPESADIHLKLARIFAKNKHLSQAEESYLAVLKQAPDNPDAHRELAAIYKVKGLSDKAAHHYCKALKAREDDNETRNALVAIYVKDKRYDEVEGLLQDSVELDPDDAISHYKLGLIYDFKKDYDAALASYKKAVELKPDYARALHAIGRVYMKTGRLSEAREALEAAKKADPNMEENSVLLNNIRDEFRPVPTKGSKAGKSKKSKKTKKSKQATKSKKSGATKKKR